MKMKKIKLKCPLGNVIDVWQGHTLKTLRHRAKKFLRSANFDRVYLVDYDTGEFYGTVDKQ